MPKPSGPNSLEEQPIGWCHHISISVEKLKKYLSEIAVKMIVV